MSSEMTQAEKTEAINEGYLRELDARVTRSELTGSITLKDRSAALYFDPSTGKFAMLEKTGAEEAVSIFDAVQREQWGRQVMVFGHQTDAGGYIASGHGTLTGDQFTIRLAKGRYYRLTVDPTLPHLAPYFVERSTEKPKPERQPKGKKQHPKGRAEHSELRNAEDGTSLEARGDRPHRNPRNRPTSDGAGSNPSDSANAHDEEHEDFDEDDLARLRGEIPMASKKSKSKRKR